MEDTLEMDRAAVAEGTIVSSLPTIMPMEDMTAPPKQ
jgi:hypothetical protein